MCAGWLSVSCAVVSVIWKCPGVWGERRLFLLFFSVWQYTSAILAQWWIGGVCLVVWGFLLYSVVFWGLCVCAVSYVGCSRCVCCAVVGCALVMGMCVCGGSSCKLEVCLGLSV